MLRCHGSYSRHYGSQSRSIAHGPPFVRLPSTLFEKELQAAFGLEAGIAIETAARGDDSARPGSRLRYGWLALGHQRGRQRVRARQRRIKQGDYVYAIEL